MGVQILLAISTYGILAGTHPWSTRCLCVEIEIEENEDLNFETLFLGIKTYRLLESQTS